MRLSYLLVLHGPHLDLLGEGPLTGQPSLPQIDEAIARAASTRAGVRCLHGGTEGDLVAALRQNAGWASHILLSPGALAPTAWVLRQALELFALPHAAVFLEALPGSAEHARRSLLRQKATFHRRGAAPEIYLDAAEKLLGGRLERVGLTAPPPVRFEKNIGRAEKSIGPARGKNEVVKTIGRAPARPHAAAASGSPREALHQKLGQRLSGQVSPAALAAWAREQWLVLESGGGGGQDPQLAEVLQALALSSAPGAAPSDTQLLEWMARLG